MTPSRRPTSDRPQEHARRGPALALRRPLRRTRAGRRLAGLQPPGGPVPRHLDDVRGAVPLRLAGPVRLGLGVLREGSHRRRLPHPAHQDQRNPRHGNRRERRDPRLRRPHPGVGRDPRRRPDVDAKGLGPAGEHRHDVPRAADLGRHRVLLRAVPHVRGIPRTRPARRRRGNQGGGLTMDAALIAGIILVVGIAVLLLARVPIAVAVGFSAFAAVAAVIGMEKASFVAAQRLFTGVNSFTLLAIPFFILAGVLMNNGGIAGRLIDAAKVLVGRMPGSLAQTNVVANALFGSVSGAAVASAAAVGGVIGPRQRKEGYDRNFSAAVNIASAPSGMLIPPSNTLIVYSLVSSTSIATLFVAGYIPGILWALACMLVVWLYVRKRPELKNHVKVSLPTALLTIWRAVPSILMIVIVIGGILAGVFTPTESAAIAVVYCLILGFIYKAIKV